VNARAGAVVGLPPSVAVKSGFRLPVVKLDRPPPLPEGTAQVESSRKNRVVPAVAPGSGAIPAECEPPLAPSGVISVAGRTPLTSVVANPIAPATTIALEAVECRGKVDVGSPRL
jgi:hypothetical protein